MSNQVFLFHVGRGGNFYNQGHHSFIGVFDSYDDAVSNIDSRRDMFVCNRDKKGRFCKQFFYDQSGHKVAEYGDLYFDFDGDYDAFAIVPIDKADINDIIHVITADIEPLPLGLNKEIVLEAWDFINNNEKDSLCFLNENIEMYGLKHKVIIEMYQTNGIVRLGNKSYYLDYDFQGKIFDSLSEGVDSVFETSGLPKDYIENLDELKDKIAIRIEPYIA